MVDHGLAMTAGADEVGAIVRQVVNDTAKLTPTMLVLQGTLDFRVGPEVVQGLEAFALLIAVARAFVVGRAFPAGAFVGADEVHDGGQRTVDQNGHGGWPTVGAASHVGGLAVNHSVTSIFYRVSILQDHRQ